jgi:2-oxoglutarate dehydrogenase E2 component (dihydrolipoamide succinyltransferase)
MKHDILVPQIGESITEAGILKWAKKNGEYVKSGDLLVEFESDKASVEYYAEASGVLTIQKNEGDRVLIKSAIGFLDSDGKATATTASSTPTPPPPPGSARNTASSSSQTLSPAVRKLVEENNVNPSEVTGTGKADRLTKGDVLAHMEKGPATASPGSSTTAPAAAPVMPKVNDRPGDRRVPMPMIRQKIAERLVYAQHTAAILSTFNEVDMKPVMDVRAKYKEAFQKKYGNSLSFMSFFSRASSIALKQMPTVNASIDGKEIVYHDYQDVGIAVGTDRGLVVPVVRGVEALTFAQIEAKIGELAKKARDGKLSIADMSGGTFTISNGGTYGSLLSTPILNPPQSAILGMHKIMERPIAVSGKVEVRPMMYLALSYDHRIIDGKEAVTFLVTLKDVLENPEKLDMEFIREL